MDGYGFHERCFLAMGKPGDSINRFEHTVSPLISISALLAIGKIAAAQLTKITLRATALRNSDGSSGTAILLLGGGGISYRSLQNVGALPSAVKFRENVPRVGNYGWAMDTTLWTSFQPPQL
jgi:hypothetical protein